MHTDRDYPQAIPVLVDHLRRPHIARVLEVIGRTLIVPQAMRDGCHGYRALVDAFRSIQDRPGDDHEAKVGLAYAIAKLASGSFEDLIIMLVSDTSHGDTRGPLIESNQSRARNVRAYATCCYAS